MLATNQRNFYQEFDGSSNILKEASDAQKVSKFWGNIWLIPGNFNENALWLPKMKEKLSKNEMQEDIRISVENVKTTVRKMTNWKALDPDFVQGYWFKRFSTLHSKLTEHLQTCVVVGDVPRWMTKGITTLIQKNPEKRNAPNNYQPIAFYHVC